MTLMTLQVGTVVLRRVIILLVNATTWWTPGASHVPGLGGLGLGMGAGAGGGYSGEEERTGEPSEWRDVLS